MGNLKAYNDESESDEFATSTVFFESHCIVSIQRAGTAFFQSFSWEKPEKDEQVKRSKLQKHQVDFS